MGLHKNFPTDPFTIINPSMRWTPGAAKTSKEKQFLLPPLVHKIRNSIYEWRNSNYDGISTTSKSLLDFWFKTEHNNNFKYYFAQRESVETIIYLYENQEIRSNNDLLKFDHTGALTDDSFSENWLRLVLKQATGTGKTKVLSLLMVWSYFNKMYEPHSALSRNFLLLCPNRIVLDRLKTDIDDLSVFHSDPMIPRRGYNDRDWLFNPEVHIRKDLKPLSTNGNIFLTNIDLFASRGELIRSSGRYFLGENIDHSNNELKETLYNLDELLIMNDEAHHIHNEELAWYRTIETIHNKLLQRNVNIPLQIDVTATPKDQKGHIFPHTVCDYPLVEAIAQEIVKTPGIPDEASYGKLRSKTEGILSTKCSEKYQKYIDAGVLEWMKSYEKNRKLGKKALIFFMISDTKDCDDVANYLENTFPILKDGVFVIHTNKNGDLAGGVSSKSQKELKEARILADTADSDGNNVKAIVSVLMLKEGWDVKNVTTIVGLRPFTHKSNILPEQALGRGLRRMYPRDEGREEVYIIGTEGFMSFITDIQNEGVVLEKRPMNENTPPAGPTLIEIDKDKDIEKLNMEIPVLSPRILRDNMRDLDELDVLNFKYKSHDIKKFSKEEQDQIVWRDVLHGKVLSETIMPESIEINSTQIITAFTKTIMSELRLKGDFPTLYNKVKIFLKKKTFTKESISLDDRNIVRNLSQPNIRLSIIDVFKTYINKLTISDIGKTEIVDYINIKETKNFQEDRNKESIINKKTLFSKTICDSHFEIIFSQFLDASNDVLKFIKNYEKLGISLEYINSLGARAQYHPDFYITLYDRTNVVVETKGLEGSNDPLKIKRLKQWCDDVARITKDKWIALYVKEEDWKRLAKTPANVSEIIEMYLIK